MCTPVPAGQYDHAGWAAYHPPPMQGCGPAIDPHWKRPRPAAVHLRPSDYSAEKEAAYTRALLLFMACNYPPSVSVPGWCVYSRRHSSVYSRRGPGCDKLPYGLSAWAALHKIAMPLAAQMRQGGGRPAVFFLIPLVG
jgi:hypothetical protein